MVLILIWPNIQLSSSKTL